MSLPLLTRLPLFLLESLFYYSSRNVCSTGVRKYLFFVFRKYLFLKCKWQDALFLSALFLSNMASDLFSFSKLGISFGMSNPFWEQMVTGGREHSSFHKTNSFGMPSRKATGMVLPVSPLTPPTNCIRQFCRSRNNNLQLLSLLVLQLCTINK